MIDRLSRDPRASARYGLAVLAAVFIISQLAVVPFADHTLRSYFSGIDPRNQWLSYLAAPAPEVLIIGDSRTKLDILPQPIAREATAALGRPVTVGKLHFDGVTPAFLTSLMERVIDRPDRPKVILYMISEFALNESYEFQLSPLFWLTSTPFDAGQARRAFERDPDRARLVAGWLVPLVAYQRIVSTGIRCSARRAVGRVEPGTCQDLGGVPPPQDGGGDVITETRKQIQFDEYRRNQLRDYRVSEQQLGYVRDLARRARTVGVTVALAVTPTYELDTVEPAGYVAFLSRTQAVARDEQLPYFDLHLTFRDRRELWLEPSHLNATGAQEFSPIVGRIVAGLLRP